jgi:hypothetical protein
MKHKKTHKKYNTSEQSQSKNTFAHIYIHDNSLPGLVQTLQEND